MNIYNKLIEGEKKAFLDHSVQADPHWTPSLKINRPQSGQKVYLDIVQELEHCTSFCLSGAFITLGGIQLLKPVLRDLEKRGVPGRILTTDYLAFTEPAAMDFLCGLNNLEVRMFVCPNDQGFHTKGYLFWRDELMCIMIGSSNITQAALCTSNEWNVQLYADCEGQLSHQVRTEFDDLFDSVNSFPYEAVRELYTRQYELTRGQRKIDFSQYINGQKSYADHKVIRPNMMQVKLIDELEKLRHEGKRKALLVSATGTGKTYAAALAVRQAKVKRLLFLVHREQIAAKALESFRKVCGDDVTYGLISGTHRETDADYLFSTIQTFSRPDFYSQFDPDEFDWIIIDEVHRSAAPSYRRIFNYFRPAFWFGMSATPQRTDGQSVYELFDFNIACQISLREALEEDLLCPFHYYALSDVYVGDEMVRDAHAFLRLAQDERIDHILEQSKYYGYSGKRLMGLIFVSTLDEARMLETKFNERGLRTMALGGANSQAERERAIERLTQPEDDEEALDYLITVDIFNEGVDIPEINQVILLRPTESAIVFIQQLGRGLRRSPDKEFVVILDFIGAGQNSFLIPVALSESQTGSKDRLIRFVEEGNREIPGASSVYFSPGARRKILKSIENAQLDSAVMLREGYLTLYEQLGRVPTLTDYDKYNAMDPLLIFSNSSYPSYYDFLRKSARLKNLPAMNASDLQLLRYISTHWAGGKRIHELLLLKTMAEYPHDWKAEFFKEMDALGMPVSERTWTNLMAQFSMNWLIGGMGERWRKLGVKFVEGDKISKVFADALEDETFRQFLFDLIEFGLARYHRDYENRDGNSWFCRGRTYDYWDTFRLLDAPVCKNPQNVGGYYYDKDVHAFPVYINYDKARDIALSIDYEDHFENAQSLIAFSKSPRRMDSPEIELLKHAEETNLFIPLFVRKNVKSDHKEFYYLGSMVPDGRFEAAQMKDGKPVVKIGYRLRHMVDPTLYSYFTQH